MAYQALIRLNQIENHRRILRPEHVMRDRINPFDSFDDVEFRKRYRFTKDGVYFIHSLIGEQLKRQTNRKRALSSEIQIFIALRYFASGTFQLNVGDLCTVSQPTVSKVIKNVSKLLAELRADFIQFPDNNVDLRVSKSRFFEIDQFPNVVGAIDGTHIKICNPGGDDAARFINRKNFFSINCQIICDSKGKILNIVARWPGSAHDSRIFTESNIKQKFDNNEISGIILGDQAYQCLPYLMTPLQNPITDAEKRYNKSHARTRGVIERMFGIWKRRFPVLRIGINTKLETTYSVIIALAVLHNISVYLNEPDPEEDDINNDMNDDMVYDRAQVRNIAGLLHRRQLINNHFSNI